MNIYNLGAIDIGSNAIRLLISYAIEERNAPTVFRKYTLVRVPIRLGEDAFLHKKISESNTKRLIDAIMSFKLLMGVYQVKHFKACATSAMRDAQNSKEVTDRIKAHTGIDIEIIDGSHEADFIAANYINGQMNDGDNYLYVDVGGGSTEFTIYVKGKIVASKSFPIGTVRLLNKMLDESVWDDSEAWIKAHTKGLKPIAIVGSGGNINKIFKVSGKKRDEYLSYAYLSKYHKFLCSYTYEQRIKLLEMHPDRADVVVHASAIFLMAMKCSGAKRLFAPEIGLSDGIIKSLYAEIKGK